MNRVFAAGAALLLSAGVVYGQAAQPVTPIVNGGAVSTGNPMPVSGSFSASLSGFAPAVTGTPITATTGGATGSLPTGTVVVVFNVGTTNTAYCKLGASATVNDIAIPPASWFSYTVGVATQITCITSTSTTTINLVGGSGLPTGAVAAGTSGGAITMASGAVSSGAYSSGSLATGAGTDGWNVTEGTQADSAWTSGSGSVIALLKAAATSASTTATNTGASVPAGTSRIGYVSDDPCTQKVKLNVPIGTSSGNLQLVAPSGSTKVYICSLFTIGQSASVQNIIEGTGAACTTSNEAAVIGSTTAASGMSFLANGGFTYANGGATIGVTATAGNGICLLQSGTVAIAGNMTYVQQ